MRLATLAPLTAAAAVVAGTLTFAAPAQANPRACLPTGGGGMSATGGYTCLGSMQSRWRVAVDCVDRNITRPQVKETLRSEWAYGPGKQERTCVAGLRAFQRLEL